MIEFRPRMLTSTALAICMIAGLATTTRADFTIRTNVWVWSGSGDWFTGANWNHGYGGLLGAPTRANLPVYIGPEAYFINGLFIGYFFPSGPAVLSQNFTSPRLDMGAGVDTSLVINNATYTTYAEIGEIGSSNYLINNPNANGTSSLTLNNASISGTAIVGKDQGGIGVLNVNGNCGVTNLVLAQSLGSTGTLNLNPGSTFTGTIQTGSGRAVINNLSPWAPLGALYFDGSSSNTFHNGATAQLEISSVARFGGTINNRGVITFEPGVTSNRSFEVSGPVTLQGGGHVVLTDPATTIIYSPGGIPVDRLLNVDNVIRGNGQIFADVVNQHIIRAEGGTLRLYAFDQFNNETGLIQVAPDGELQVIASHASGPSIGKIQIEPDGLIIQSTLRSPTFVGPAPLEIFDTIEFVGTVTNVGVIRFFPQHGGGASRIFEVEGPVTLSGGGQLVLTDQNASIQAGSGNLPGDLLINLDHTIRGNGFISANVDNRSIIRAENGLLTLYAYEGFKNQAGTIQVASDGVLRVYASFVQDVPLGPLDIEPGGVITSSTLNQATLIGDGDLVIHDNIEFVVSLYNEGVVTFDTFAAATRNFEVEGPVTLSGGGEIVLNSQNASIQAGGGNLPGDLLVNLDHTIRGNGFISANVDNRSVIRAENGLLTLYAYEGFMNQGGTIQVASDGALRVYADASASPALGDLAIEGGGVVTSSTLKNTNLIGSGPLEVIDSITFVGTINNPGLITYSPFAGTTRTVLAEGPVTLQGGGQLVITDSNATIGSAGGGLPGDQFTNLNHTIAGSGTVSAKLVNRGTLAPGGNAAGPIGLLSLEDASLLHADGILQLQIKGARLGSYDRIRVANGLTLGGTLQVSLVSGFVPEVGDSFSIVTGTSGSQPITGTFDAFEFPAAPAGYRWAISYSGMEVRLFFTCAGDFNGDGFGTFEDFDDYVRLFELGDPYADLDGDGFLTFEDFDAFVGAFETGC